MASADFSDLQFLSRPQPVLAHPLLQTTTFAARNKVDNKREKVEEVVEEKQSDNDESQQEQQQFLDPLGAASNDSKENSRARRSFRQQKVAANDGTSAHQKHGQLAPEIVGPLDNTLAKPDADEAELEWPVRGLDSSLEQHLIGFRPWRQIRQRILDQFSTADRLTLESSFLSKSELPIHQQNGGIAGISTANKRQRQMQQRQRMSATVVKEKKRPIDGSYTADGQPTTKFHDLSQEEWVRKLTELRRQLQQKWAEEKRLDCIKLVAELLAQLGGNICSAQFYPAQFVHITDLLDLFGWLVWQRLMQLAQEERRKAGLGPLPSQWTINDVLGDTRLKARNWFGKINQTVKVLTARIYMLAAILPCQRFMDPWPGAAQENALELCRGAQQVQHPLISSYLRCYLCRTAMRVAPQDRAPHWKCLNDWLQTYTQQPISLLWPAMEWIVQCVAYTAVAYADLHPLWEYCRRLDKRPMVLVPMLNALPRLYLGEHALEACRIITSSELVTGEELVALGRNLLDAEIPQPALKPILRSAWKCILRLGSLKEYLTCCECWCQFVVRHFTANEVQVVLENIMRKLNQDKFELYHQQLLSILCKIFAQSREVRSLLDMEIFVRFFDIFHSAAAPIRAEAAQAILGALVEKHPSGTFADVSLAYQILSVCQLLHDSVELSAPADCVAEAIGLICSALDRVELSGDPDQCMAFFVSCRADLSSWDALQRYVIRRVQSFTLQIVRSVRYTSARAAFLQGCLANLFISIPSLTDPLDRIELSIQSAQIALAALAYLQADSFLDFALGQFADLQVPPADSGQRLLRIGTSLLATLAALPQTTGTEISVDQMEKEAPQLRHFHQFLQSLLSLQWPISSAAKQSQTQQQQWDKICLFMRCLQYIFVVQTKGNNNSSLESSEAEAFNASCAELADQIAEAIEAPLLAEEQSELVFAVGMELLETIAQFGADDQHLPPRLRGLAKAVYKRCRRRPALAARISRLKASK